jgi:hypothetical protein
MDVLEITRTIVTPTLFISCIIYAIIIIINTAFINVTHALQLELQEQRLLWDYLQGYSSILLRIPLQLVVRQLGTVHLYYSINRWFVVQ